MIFPGKDVANVDAGTNTECVFIQQPIIGRKKSQGDILSRLGAVSNSSSVKRSKTFSPSAPIAKSHYNCRVLFIDSICDLTDVKKTFNLVEPKRQ